MNVRIVSDVSDERRSYAGGEVVDLPEDKAARWIKAGIAVAADEKPGAPKKAGANPHEAAALADPPESATLPPAQKRGA